jgi:pimeloyl-ACP methyl ester carboxylesterase
MISPYELAFLSGHAYRDNPQIIPASYVINIPQAGDWGVGAHDGVSDSFFCTKYTKAGTYENIIAFRGTGGRVADIAVDAQHLLTRNSGYISAARAFLRRYGDRNTVVTGHSLGGFIAISMAFYQSIKVAAFNPPWMGTLLTATIDQFEAATSPSFQSSKIIVYQSNTDVVTSATHSNRIRARNVNFTRIGAHGWHNLDPIIEEFRLHRRYAIRW